MRCSQNVSRVRLTAISEMELYKSRSCRHSKACNETQIVGYTRSITMRGGSEDDVEDARRMEVFMMSSQLTRMPSDANPFQAICSQHVNSDILRALARSRVAVVLLPSTANVFRHAVHILMITNWLNGSGFNDFTVMQVVSVLDGTSIKYSGAKCAISTRTHS